MGGERTSARGIGLGSEAAMRSWIGGLLFAAVVASATLAFADTPPSAWDRARDPAAIERYRLHEHIEQELAATPKEMRGILREAVRAELEAASAATSPDVRLRFDLGEVYESLDRHEEALAVLRPALAMAPHHSAAPRAWLSFAFAAAKLDRSAEEIEGYDAFLASSVVDDPSVLANRAEAEMRLGNLDAAIAGYSDVIERIEHGRFGTMADLQELVLARWGLAVALDRAGDRTASEAALHIVAVVEDPEEHFIGDHDAVFFVPDYERDWYYALGRAERARVETNPVRALGIWNLVVATWADYVQRASKARAGRALAPARARASRDGEEGAGGHGSPRCRVETRAQEASSGYPRGEASEATREAWRVDPTRIHDSLTHLRMRPRTDARS